LSIFGKNDTVLQQVQAIFKGGAMIRKNFLICHPDQAPADGDPHWIFLTPAQAVDAVALDFQAYGPQSDLFRRIAPLILGEQCRITRPDENGNRVSILRGNTFYPVSDQNLEYYLIHVLETAPLGLNTLARICEMVFQTRTAVGYDSIGCTSGIWVHSQMDRFVCRQCGKCCRTLNFETDCEASDLRLWRDLGRSDILAWVLCRDTAATTSGGLYRIWVDPSTGETARTCPWLAPCPSRPDLFACTIHDIKPAVCRQYPYTGKHAAMTGCDGLFAPEPLAPHDPKDRL
jgi:Fe-S-cluster containining protein